MSDASLRLLLTKPLCVVPRGVAPRGWRHLHSWRPRTLFPLRRRPKRLFVQGRALAFVAASHLNDKDALVGRAGVGTEPCDAVGWAGGGDRQRFLCVPTPGSGGAGFLQICAPRLTGAELHSRSRPTPGERAPPGWSRGALPAPRRVGASRCSPCHMWLHVPVQLRSCLPRDQPGTLLNCCSEAPGARHSVPETQVTSRCKAWDN